MKRARGAVVLLSVVLAGCAHAPETSVPSATPASPPSLDLSGEWTSGSGVPPGGAVVTITRPCGRTVTEWRFTHVTPHLGGALIAAAPLTGEPHDLPITEWINGSTDTSEFALRAWGPDGKITRAAYHLRYDAATRRLRGTRDGDSVWFAPLRVQEPRDCRDGITAPAPFDLSGRWATGRGAAEPAQTSSTLRPGCTFNPAAWVLQQTRDSVEAWSFPASRNQGTRSLDGPRVTVPARGRVSGLDVTLQDATARYRLRYDPESGHLRGTLNGVPFWALRQIVVQEACPAVP
jgi:hypothetical protein